MNIVDLELRHLAEARDLAHHALQAERNHLSLPDAELPDLTWLVHNGMGVAAEHDGRLVGYLGAWGPVDGMFGTSNLLEGKRFVGVFSPVQAHAVAEDAPKHTWQRLYQGAAEKWAAAGAVYHAIVLYEHDVQAKRALFRYGFGQRCADAIRPAEPLAAADVPWAELRELPPGSAEQVRELRILLDRHLGASPTFMVRSDEACQAWLERVKDRDSRLFIAAVEGRPAAFIEVCAEGENFLTEHPLMMNICGAYCLEEYRGRGLSKALLDHVLHTLRREGVAFLGVDYETLNPTAVGFWEKYFTPYTVSLVRRIDR